ncbi:MAG TPA: F0F1 ATP synthase subunit B [Actinomycetota bacterium]|nr:F0F1 ATP synthase subunit B [Actinomycetota bacterium]
MILAADSITAIHPATALWTWGVFIATLFLLSKIAWPMLMNKMEEREVRIEEGLKKAEEAEARARELADRQEQVLAEARQEAQRLLAESRAAAENARNDLLAAAQEEIAAQRERAKREINQERVKAIDDLKKATVDLTLEASARLLRRELQDEDHRRLAREVVEEVASRL